MTLDEFQSLSEQNQLAAVYAAGTFVARRWQEVDEAVLLYRMPGHFFAEPTYNNHAPTGALSKKLWGR